MIPMPINWFWDLRDARRRSWTPERHAAREDALKRPMFGFAIHPIESGLAHCKDGHYLICSAEAPWRAGRCLVLLDSRFTPGLVRDQTRCARCGTVYEWKGPCGSGRIGKKCPRCEWGG
jgi:hypothetical protein